MFEQIVSKLSLSPSAASDLAFYARRLKGERGVRTLSAIAAVLVIVLQFAVITAPPTPVNAASSNDIIYGGIVSKDDLLNHYDGSAELKSLYAYFGITRQDIVGSKVATINSKDHSLKSIGRLQHLASDQKLTVAGKYTYWSRGLYTWDTGANVTLGSSYQVLEGTRSVDGGFFAVMFTCGNIVYKALPPTPKPTPPPPPPTPKPTPKPTPTPTPTPKTPTPKPSASATPSPTPTPKPTLACTELIGNDITGKTTGQVPLTVNYSGLASATGQTITAYNFNFGDNQTKSQSNANTSHTYTTAGTWTATLTVTGSSGATTTTPQPGAACTFTVTTTTTPAAFTKTKSALNLTQNIDATTAAAKPGDVIRYILITKNTGGTAEPYTVVEHLEDVLQYADLTDAGGGTLTNGVMTWPQTTIQPGASLTESFQVTVKNPVPTTPVGISDKSSYDLTMDNVYGNAVMVKVQPPLPKEIEAASAQLPDTGAGTSVVIVLIIAGLSLFFYLRNRQLMAEIKLLRSHYQGGL